MTALAVELVSCAVPSRSYAARGQTKLLAHLPVIAPPNDAYQGAIPVALSRGQRLHASDYLVEMDDSGAFIIKKNIEGWGLVSQAVAGSDYGKAFLNFIHDKTHSRLLVLVSNRTQTDGFDEVLDARIVSPGKYETIFDGQFQCQISPDIAYLAVVNANNTRMRAFRLKGDRIDEADLPAPQRPCDTDDGG